MHEALSVTVIKLTRGQDFLMIANYKPFIFVGYLQTLVFSDDWGATFADSFLSYNGIRLDIASVFSNYLNTYSDVGSLANVELNEGTLYFDKANQLVYFHADHSHNPIFSGMGIGYAYGFSKGELIYINDVAYLPLIKSIPTLARETDILGSKKPTKATGTVVLNNMEIKSLDTGRREGILDFLIDEPVYGNPLYVYDYDGIVLTPLSSWTIKKPTISETEVRLELLDRRYA